MTEEEDKDEEKEKKEKEAKQSKSQLNSFFFEPNGKGPKWENFAIVAFLSGAFGYTLATMGSAPEEITYMEFINQYLAQNQVKMITISEDQGSDSFKYRASIETHSGKKVYMVLP